MNLKELQKEIKSLLSSKAYAEAVGLCELGLNQFENEVSLLLLLASAYYGVKAYEQVYKTCNDVLTISPNNATALTGMSNSCQHLKKYHEYSQSLTKLLDLYYSQQNAKSYWEEVNKAISFYKSSLKYTECILLLERILENGSICSFLFEDDSWKERPKKINLLKELEHFLEKQENASSGIKILNKKTQNKEPEKSQVMVPNTKLANIYTAIISELAQQKSPMSAIQSVNYKLKLIHRLYQTLFSDKVGQKIKNTSFLQLEKLSREIPSLSKESPYDEIYFNVYLATCNLSYSNFIQIYEDFYLNDTKRMEQSLSNRSILAQLYHVHSDVLTDNYTKALADLNVVKDSLAKYSELFHFPVKPIQEIVALLEGQIYFFLGLYQDAFDILFSLKDCILALNINSLNVLFVRLLNEQKLFEEAIAFAPKSPSVNVILEKGWTYFLNDNIDVSLRIFIDHPLPDSTLYDYRLGRIYYSCGRFAESIVHFQNSVQSDPSNFDSLAYLGLIYLKQNQVNEAEKYFDRSLSINTTENAFGVQHYGDLLMSQCKWEQSISLFSKFLTKNPRSSAILRNLSISRYKTNAFADCISTLHLCLRIDFRDPEAWELLGECYFKEGRYHAALKAFQRALEINPAMPFASLFIAFIKDKLSDYNEAIDRLISLAENPVVGRMAMLYLLDVYLDVFLQYANSNCFGIAFDKLSECINYLTKYVLQLDLDKHFSLWRFFSKVIYFSRRNPQFSLLDRVQNLIHQLKLETRLKFNDDFSDDLCVQCNSLALSLCSDDKMRAILYNDLGIFTQNESHFLHSIKLDPTNEDYWNSLGVYYVTASKFLAARKAFQIVIEHNAKAFSGWINLGFTYFLLPSEQANALKCFEEAQRLAPLNPLPWVGKYLLGDFLNDEFIIHAIDLSDKYIPEFVFIAGNFFYQQFISNPKEYTFLTNSYKYFLLFLQSNPTSVECNSYLGMLCELQKHFDLSLMYFKNALKYSANTQNSELSINIRKNIGRVLYCMGKLEESAEIFEGIDMKFHSLSDKIIFGLATLNSNLEKSLQLFSECYSSSSDPFLSTLFVKVLFSTGNIQLAGRQLIKLTSQSVNVDVLKMALILAIKNNDSALISSSIDSLLFNFNVNTCNFVDLQLFLCKILQIMKVDDQSVKILNNAAMIFPHNINLWKAIDTESALALSYSNGQIAEFSEIVNSFNAPSIDHLTQSILINKYSTATWKQLSFSQPHNLKFIRSLKVFDSQLAGLMQIEQQKDFEALEKVLENPPSSTHYNLALRILFRSFKPNLHLSLLEKLSFANISTLTFIEICQWIFYHKKSLHPSFLLLTLQSTQTHIPILYRLLWQFNDDSIKQISGIAKKQGKHTKVTLLLQAIVYFYALNDKPNALKIINKILANESDEPVANSFLSILNLN